MQLRPIAALDNLKNYVYRLIERCTKARGAQLLMATLVVFVLAPTAASHRRRLGRRTRAPVAASHGRVLAPVAVDRSPSPPRSWAKTAGSPQVHVSDARDRRDGLRQARV